MRRATRVPSRLAEAQAVVRERLAEAATVLGALGVPRFPLQGRLLRPLAAYAFARDEATGPAGPRFWSAALAVQLAHEASLLHDDVIDGAGRRRGTPTAAAVNGPAAALILGDHALTAAYRAAAMSGDLGFVCLFARAVERTVAGERTQAASADAAVDVACYRKVVLGKSGELVGCAMAVGPTLRADRRASAIYELGRRVGLLYQMLDDLLDYCPHAETGKPALGDYAQRRWTWPLAHLDDFDAIGFGADPHDVARLLARGAGRSALAAFEAESLAVRAELAAAGADLALDDVVAEWADTARAAVRQEESALRASTAPVAARVAVPKVGEAGQFMGRHSRSFHFASRLLPRDERGRIERVYAWCRYTDDLADGIDIRIPGAGARAGAALDEWRDHSRSAYDGLPSGVALVDRVMSEMADAGVPFAYAATLVDGVRMDLRPASFDDANQLRAYTYRVASVVGLWLCELHGVRDQWMLECAAALGHAMQLTNILRDVGEDLDRGRLYLPLALMRAHGVAPEDLSAWREGHAQMSAGYPALLEELIALAESDYRRASEAIPCLPAAFGRAVAVAADVYAGIHNRIRANGYDNVRLRAHTSAARKLALATRALWTLRRRVRERPTPGPLGALCLPFPAVGGLAVPD